MPKTHAARYRSTTRFVYVRWRLLMVMLMLAFSYIDYVMGRRLRRRRRRCCVLHA